MHTVSIRGTVSTPARAACGASVIQVCIALLADLGFKSLSLQWVGLSYTQMIQRFA